MSSTPPLFDMPAPGPVPQSRTIPGPEPWDRPRWTRYRPRDRVQCSECVLVLHENGGQGPVILGARWRLAIGSRFWFLCDPHADLRKANQ